MNSLSNKHWTGLVSLRGVYTILHRYRMYVPHVLGSWEAQPLVLRGDWHYSCHLNERSSKTSFPWGLTGKHWLGCVSPFFNCIWKYQGRNHFKKPIHMWSAFASKRKALCYAGVKLHQLGHEEMNHLSCWTDTNLCPCACISYLGR